MNALGTSYQSCERIVSQEMYRRGGKPIGVLNADDIKQELMIAAINGAGRDDGRPGDGYVRTCVRNAIVQMYVHVSASKRQSKDLFGTPVWFASPDVVDISTDSAPDPEAFAMARERIEWLVSILPREEAELVERAARGETELTSGQAEHIRYMKVGGRMSDEYSVPESNVAVCHVRGEDPEGYSADETACHSCDDKFSCLPESVAKPSVWKNAPRWTVNDDHEVAGLLAKEMTFKEVRARMVRRVRLIDAGEVIPAELLVRRLSDVVDPEPPASADTEPPIEPGPSAEEPAPAQEAPVASKKKVVRPPKKKAASKKKVSKKKDVPVRPRSPTVARDKKTSGHRTPAPCPIPEEKMVAMMAQVKLGVAIDFGMQIVRRTRDGVEHVVTITKNGFLYNDQHYSSLSAAAQVASGQFRSGNDWFGMHHLGAQVRSDKGTIIASKTVGR